MNLVTGDFSRGASGIWIQNGELTFPVEEITVAGNLKDMLCQRERDRQRPGISERSRIVPHCELTA